MAKKKKKNNIEFEVGLDGNITKYNEPKIKKNNNIEFEVDLDGNIHKYDIEKSQPKQQKKKIKEDKSFLESVGDFELGTLKTIGNFATNMGEAALRGVEASADAISNLIANPIERGITYTVDKMKNGEEIAKENLEDLKKQQRKDIEKDLTGKFLKNVGFTKDIKKSWEKDSLVTSENIGGQVAQAIGGMIPTLVVGSAIGSGPVSNASTKGLSTGDKIITHAKNIGRNIKSNAPSNAMLASSSYGSALQEAYQNGATEEEAVKYALGSSATELATEWITGGIPGLEGTGVIDKAAKSFINKSTGKVKNGVLKGIKKTLLNAGYEIVGEGFEEGLSELVSPLLKNATYSENEEINWNDVFQSAIVGGITGGILNLPSTAVDFTTNIKEGIQEQKANKATNETENVVSEDNNSSLNTNVMPSANQNTVAVNNVENTIDGNPLLNNNLVSTMPSAIQNNSAINNIEPLSNISNGNLNDNTVNLPQNMPSSVQNIENNANVQEVVNTPQNNVLYNENLSNQNEQPYQYIKSTNPRIDNLRQSATQYFNNSQEIRDFVGVAEKVIKDKDYSIVFDNTLSSESDKMVNAQITTLENGETEIRLNPNSSRSGEFLLTHEITHAIETKDMVNLVMDYASKNQEFNTALESLKETYNTSDVSSEVLADISGQLFGNQDFINNLSTQKPNIFKRIYDTIISLANKITGNSKESLFIRDLKNKWEKAYRQSDLNTARENLKNNEKLSLSKNALQEVSDVVKQTREEAETDNRQFVKLKDNTIKALVDYGIKDLPMLERNGHVRENILTEKEAKKLGYSTKNKHFHGLGVKTYLEIIDSMDNPIAVYQYTDKGKYSSNNFIVLTPIEINGVKAIVPVEINQRGQYNQVEIDYNKIKTTYSKDSNDYINKLLNQGKIKEIFTGSNSQQTSLSNNTIPSNEKHVNSFKEKPLEERVSGDDLLDAQDLIDELKNVNSEVDDNGYVTVYHQTSEDNAKKIQRTGKMISKEQAVFFSTSKEAQQSAGRGTVKLKFKIPVEKLKLDDIFSDNADVRIDLDGNESVDISSYIINDDIRYSKENREWQDFVEKNFKSKGTKSYFKDMKIKENKSNSKATKGQVKRGFKSKFKQLSKVIQYEDYNHQEEFKKIVSKYSKNTSLETIREDLEKHFVQSKKEYAKDIINHIRYEIAKNDIKITDTLKRKFSSYSIFKKNNLDLMKLKDEGTDIIDLYNNLSKKYPSVFQKESIAELDELKLDDVRAKMLNRISSFLHESSEIQSKYKLESDAISEVVTYIYDSIQDGNDIDSLIETFEMSPKQIRKERTAEYRELASNFLDNSGSWKDKKMGLSYKTNTMQRNFYDVMGKKDGQKLYENFIEPIFKHNASMQEDITNYNNRIKKFKLSDKESQAVQMLGELKYNPETLVTQMQVDEIIEKNNLDFDKISKAVEEFRTIYDELFTRLNVILKNQGFKEIEYRKGYFPHFTVEKANTLFGKGLEKLGWKIKNNDIPTDIAGLTENFKPGKAWTSFSQRRVGKFTDYDVLQGFDNYIRGAMENIYFTEDIQKLRALENEIRYEHSDSGIKARVDEIQSNNDLTFDEKQEKIDKIYQQYFTPLNNLVTELRDYTNSLANKKSGLDRTMEQLTNRKVYSVMQNITQRLSANMVGMNFGSAITNFIPITQAVSQVKGKYLIQALKESIKNQYSLDGFEAKSVFLTTRLNAADRLYKTGWEKASEKANFMFECIDSITSNVIVRGKYLENIKSKKMNEFDAMRDADNFARRLMAGRSKGEMPTAFNSKNPLIKMLTSFQLEVNNQYQYMFKDLPRYLEDESKKKLVAAFVKMFIGAYLYNQFTEKIVGRKSAFSPVDTIKEIYNTSTNDNLTIKEKSADILENLSQDIPFVGGLIGGGRLPISSVANPLKVLKGESTVPDELKKLAYYTIAPFGGGQIKKSIEGAGMYLNNKEIKGSYNKKGELRFEAKTDLLSIAQNVLFGQYSSKNAREYFDKGYMPISKKTMDRLKKENISISQYREYEDNYKSIKDGKGNKLNEIKSSKNENGKPINGSASAKKAYLVMNSNFSKKEKNYMLSKISNFNNSVDFKTLKKLENNKKAFELYYSMNKDNREKFINELDDYDISVNKLTDYYSTRSKINKDYNSGMAKEKLIDYITNSNLNDDTKWYLYSKDYGNDNLDLQRSTFNIKSRDYFNVMRYKNFIENKYPGREGSQKKKREVFNYINNLSASAVQKIVLFSQAGYSDSSHKDYMFQYINSLPMSKAEKTKIWNSIY